MSVSQPGLLHLLNRLCTCTGTHGEEAAPAAMPAELHMAAPQPRLSRHQQQALLMLGLVLIAAGQWQRAGACAGSHPGRVAVPGGAGDAGESGPVLKLALRRFCPLHSVCRLMSMSNLC